MCSKTVILASMCLLQVVLALPGAAPGFGSFGLYGKQMGMSFALAGKATTMAKNEVKLQLDAAKAKVALLPADDCTAAADAALALVDADLLTAFDRCSMKNDMGSVRLQMLAYKQQMATMKMAKKSCKLELDPLQCMTDLAESTAGDAAAGNAVGGGITDVLAKSGDCLAEVKKELQDRISAAEDDLLLC